MKAVFNGQVLAESDKDDLIFIERMWYFPPSSVKKEFLEESDMVTKCFWKGDANYYHVNVGGKKGENGAFVYRKPFPSAIEKVDKDFSGYIAFWQDVEVKEDKVPANA